MNGSFALKHEYQKMTHKAEVGNFSFIIFFSTIVQII